MPHPAWDVIRPWVEGQARVYPRSEAWGAVLDAWLGQLRRALGARYHFHHSARFHLVSAQSKGDCQALLDFAELARTMILDALPGVACDPPSGQYLILAAANLDTYYAYISHYYPEGEFGDSGAIFLGGDCAHIALVIVDINMMTYYSLKVRSVCGMLGVQGGREYATEEPLSRRVDRA
ncbi:MAG TPA: hypothetical protein VN648_23310, partial [Candidatus Methylomirabilis sp.]|nr:hypothetical protein [Candidatus Methylomirabilis sp.]